MLRPGYEAYVLSVSPERKQVSEQTFIGKNDKCYHGQLSWDICAMFENICSRVSQMLSDPGSAICCEFEPYRITIFVGKKMVG